MRAVALRCDVTDEKCAWNHERSFHELGGLDILVNNAANYETVDFDRLTVKQWDAILLQHAWAVSGFARGVETSAAAEGQDHQHGVARRIAAVDDATLTTIQSSGAHADQVMAKALALDCRCVARE